MVRLAAAAVVVTLIGLAVGGWVYVTSYTDAGAGDGWRLLYAARGAGGIHLDEAALDGASRDPFGEVIWRDAELHRLWDALGEPGAAPVVAFETMALVRATVIGSGSCPPHFDGLEIGSQHVAAHASKGFWLACSGDAVSYTFLVAVDRDRLPDVPFDLRVAADGWSWQRSVSPWARDS